jgi:uncharacterized cupredoxin-like copper-binding protein
MSQRAWAGITMALAGSLVACSGSSEHRAANAGASRFVDVVMRDFAYSPTTVAVRTGETVTFVFHNTDKVVHDAFLGDEAAQAKHELEMSGTGMGEMSAHDSDTTVAPGQIATLTHTFMTAGSTVIGCHEPGHYKAGMRLRVRVK